MASTFSTLLPLITAYMAEVVKNHDREYGRPPSADVSSLVWKACCCLEAGVHLKGEGRHSFRAVDIEALMGDRRSFTGTIQARALREATRLALLECGGSPSGRSVSVKSMRGIDLDRIVPPASQSPRFSLKAAHTLHRLILYSLINDPLDLDDSEWCRRRAALKSFIQRAYLNLPQPDRRLVGLRAIVGLSWDEIVEKTEVPRTTAWRRYHSAINGLARAIDDWSRDSGDGGPAPSGPA